MSALVIAYVPAVHAGVLAFLRRNPKPLYVLGRSFDRLFPLLSRDLRRLEPQEVVGMIQALDLVESAEVLELPALANLIEKGRPVVMPYDDVGRELARRYFLGWVVFDCTFLRYDKMASLNVSDPAPSESISVADLDRKMIVLAREEAEKSPDWWRQVGAVLVRDGAILLTSYNQHMPTEHSVYILGDPRSNFDAGERNDLTLALHGEESVIAVAARLGIATDEAHLYVTTFPCPRCAFEIVAAGIRKVFYADGYSMVGASDTFRFHGVEVVRVIF